MPPSEPPVPPSEPPVPPARPPVPPGPPPVQPDVPPPGFGRLVLPFAATIGAAFGAFLYGFSVLITQGAAGGEFSSTVLSAGFGGGVLAGGLAAVPVGRAVDRRGVRGVLALGAGLFAAGFTAFALARQPWQVLAAWWLLIGPGSAMVLFDPAFVAIEQWFDRAQRNRAAGTLTVVTGLAGPVFVPATHALVELVGWRLTAFSLGSLVAVAGWLTAGVALTVAPPPPTRGERRGPRLREATAQAGFARLTVAMALLFAALEAVQVHRIARFEEAGFAAGTVAWWAAFASLLSLPGRYVLPRLATRVRSSGLLLVLVLLLVPAHVLAVRGAASWELAGHFVLFGILFGATIPLRAVVMGDWFRGPAYGTLMGVQGLAIALGRAGGPSAVGWLRDATGGYGAGMVLLVAVMTAVAWLVWRCDRGARAEWDRH